MVGKHTRIKDLAFSAQCIYSLNEIQGQDVSLVSQALAPFRREMLRSRVNLACKFHKKVFSIEAGIIILVPKNVSVSDSRVVSFRSFLFKTRLVSQVCSSAIPMFQVWICFPLLLQNKCQFVSLAMSCAGYSQFSSPMIQQQVAEIFIRVSPVPIQKPGCIKTEEHAQPRTELGCLLFMSLPTSTYPKHW